MAAAGLGRALVRVAVAGLWAFGFYIAALYGVGLLGATSAGGTACCRRATAMSPGTCGKPGAGRPPHPGLHRDPRRGAPTGSQIRARAPWLHRWNGRLFVVAAVVAAASGVFIALTRGAVAGSI
uniref:Uncharacterized protein n=1 Tax=Phenylobacterium glaciei TaxID=2803784 RepID=A0A974P1Y9_9CAUL|nr:hypothetical protein JKL49_19000 [Phenylobacterium glaciei]